MSIRILLVDDHSVVRQGLRMFLGLDPDLEVVGEASNGAEGIELVRELHPDVVLMDLLMPVMDGISAIQQLRKEFPDVEVIALTSILEDDKVVGAVRAGAIGYLLKDTQADELCRAIKSILENENELSFLTVRGEGMPQPGTRFPLSEHSNTREVLRKREPSSVPDLNAETQLYGCSKVA